MLWVVIVVITAAVTLWVTRPLWTTSADATDAGGDDPATRIYKDQLREIDQDVARGILSSTEAEAAHAEVARRLLEHDTRRDRSAPVKPQARSAAQGWSTLRIATVALAAGLPFAALSGYSLVGTPFLPDLPFARRDDGAREQMAAVQAFERLEEHLAANPKDGEAWDRIAPVYLRLEQFDKAVTAFEQAVALKGESMQRLSGLAQARIFLDGGRVGPAALKALQAMLRLQPDNLDTRFWVAVGREEAGDVVGAIDEYRSLLETGPEKAPWRPLAKERLHNAAGRLATSGPRIGKTPEVAEAGGAPPGMPQLSPEQIEAGKRMSAGDQKSMIEGMVGRLAERLKTNGRDPEGWQRLVNAYMVLGRKDDAIAALGDARRQLAGDQASLAALDALAKKLGIGS